MNRRNFIKVTGLGIGTIAFNSSLVGCSDLSSTQQQADNGFGWNNTDFQQKDIRFKVLAYAMLCPNPHNKQPWIIKLTGPASFELYVDQTRLLPETDPFHRQIHIGQGTFLETLSIAATGLGLLADIKYFPQGMYNNNEVLDKPIAAIKLIKNPESKVDPLFTQLLTRHSNKREYKNKGLSSEQLNHLNAFHRTQHISQLEIVDSPQHKQHMQRILTEAMQIEVGNKNRDMETIKMFRFNDQEIAQYRDGFGLAQSGVSGVKKFIVENLFLSRENTEKDPITFGEQAVEMTNKISSSTNTFGWISTTGNSRLDQVKVGREYCRINLEITAMGLVMHPMSQVLQEYPDMLPLQASFKKTFNINANNTVQMLFRLGHAEPTKHSPRRLVTQLVQN